VSDDPYLYPDSHVLRNKLGITDPKMLDAMERQLVADRISQGPPTGNFDLVHLRAIHKHLFQDIYEWAGELRTVEIAKSGHQFQFRRYIATGLADVHRRLLERNCLRGLTSKEFSRNAAEIVGDINYAHPFREGNGRVQLQYLKQVARQAGHSIDLTLFPSQGWIEASRASHEGNYDAFAQVIFGALSPDATK